MPEVTENLLKENPHLDIDIGKKFGGEVLDTSWSILKSPGRAHSHNRSVIIIHVLYWSHHIQTKHITHIITT